MARPPSYALDDLLAAAVSLAAEGGADAVTMVSVARALQAPSGSVYHRIHGRPSLLGQVWLAAVSSFEDAWWRVAAESVDPGEVATAPLVWAAAEPERARILAAHHRKAFLVEGVDEAVRTAVRDHEARLAEHFTTLSLRFLRDDGPDALRRTRFALATVPLAAVRAAHAGRPADLDLVADTARHLLRTP